MGFGGLEGTSVMSEMAPWLVDVAVTSSRGGWGLPAMKAAKRGLGEIHPLEDH